ncbi:MAG TPA: tetratricopeptide repeat protein, partial [Dongiaceae bacterium]|nr:tetratricopeptide repeat protein [Dongiaceae bacterium]
LPLTFLMGTTFPIAVAAWPESGRRRGAALLYGVNTLGAAAGALVGTFAALPRLGTRGTFAFAAAASGLAALVARKASDLGREGDRALPPGDAAFGSAAIGVDATPRDLTRFALLSGMIGAILQTGWTRVMTLAFGSSVFALGLTLAAVLCGLGLGPLIVRPRDDTGAGARARAAASAWVAGAVALALLPILGTLPTLAARWSGLYAGSPFGALALQFLLAGLLLVVPAMAQGATLPLLIAASPGSAASVGRASGRLYAASSAGAVIGFVAAGYLLLPIAGTRLTLAAAAAGSLLLAFLLGGRRAAGNAMARGRQALLAAAPLVMVLLPGWSAASLSGGGLIYGALYRAAAGNTSLADAMRRRGDLVYARDGADGLVTVRRSPAGILSLQINGKTEASSGADMATQLLAAHLPLLLHGAADRTLIIGLASGVTLGAAERHPGGAIDVVEIARGVPDAARRFDAENRRALDDPRARLVIDDARAWLLARPGRYDVIASQPSNPWVAGVAGLFTTDMYRLLRDRLAPGGVLAQWVQAYRLEPRDLSGIVRSFLEVFPDATLWEESPGGGDYFLVAGLGRGRIDPGALARGPAPAWDDLKGAGIDGPSDLLARYVAGPEGLARIADGAPRHTDDNLYLEWRAPLALLRQAPPQWTLFTRGREPVAGLLLPGSLERDPDLAAGLARSLRRRDARLEAARALGDADRIALLEPRLQAGIVLLGQGRFAEAAADLAGAAAAAPNSASTGLLLGQAYLGAGLPGAAAVAFAGAVEHDPGLAEAWNGLGLAFAAAGRDDEARRAFEEAVARAPASSAALNNLGTELLRAGDLDGAGARFDAALVLDPEFSAALANRGLLARRRGDPDAAARGYRAALAADPGNADARYNLAKILGESGRIAAARSELETILAADPSDAEARRALDLLARTAADRPGR